MRRFLLALLGVMLLLGGCRKEPETLTVMAGSELENLEPLLPDLEKATNLRLVFTFTGTLEGVDRLTRGETADLAWFSHAKYLSLVAPDRVLAQEKIMLSPVVLGVKRSLTDAWGWTDNPDLTWREIATKAASGDLRYAMTNPTASNSGFTALMGVVAALSGTGYALETGDINRQAVQGFFRGQVLTAASSGWLSDSYVREQDRLGGMVNYESVLMELNASGKLSERLELLYPKEGIVTADYPLILLNEDKREAYDKLVAYLRSHDVQERIMNTTLRRPAVPGIPLNPAFPQNVLVELPFPGSRTVVDNILFAYLNDIRVPSHAIFVLDTSGSMEGERLADLKAALANLTGLDTSLTGQFAQFSDRERVTLIPFSSLPEQAETFSITSGATREAVAQEIRMAAEDLHADGGTAIFSALEYAYRVAEGAMRADSDRYYSVVLMTDGENNEGITEDAFLNMYRGLPEAEQRIRTFPIVFGEANAQSLERIAEVTGGRLFDGRSSDLSSIFKQIRGYQ